MAFNRLQIGLSLLCLLTFGASVGFILAGIPTYMPFIFVGFVITIVVVSFQGFETGIREFIGRNRNVTQPVEHVAQESPLAHQVYTQAEPEQAGSNQPESNGWLREACSSFWTNVKAFFQSVADGTREFADRNGPQARQILANASDSVRSTASASSDRVGASIKNSPYLWESIILSIASITMFSYSYVNQSYGAWFHVGFVPAIGSVFFLAAHINWTATKEWLTSHKAVIWLVASVISLAVAIGHSWSISSIVYSAISTLCAIITVVNGWDRTKQGAKKTMKTLIGFLVKLFSGGFGYGKMFLMWAAALFVVMTPKLMSGQPMSKEEQDFFSYVAVGFVLCLIAGVLIGFHSVAKPENKDTKKK